MLESHKIFDSDDVLGQIVENLGEFSLRQHRLQHSDEVLRSHQFVVPWVELVMADRVGDDPAAPRRRQGFRHGDGSAYLDLLDAVGKCPVVYR